MMNTIFFWKCRITIFCKRKNAWSTKACVFKIVAPKTIEEGATQPAIYSNMVNMSNNLKNVRETTVLL